MRKLTFGFLRDHQAVAATEFALVVPLLLILLLAVIELSNFSLQNRRAHQAAVLAAEFMSRDGDNFLSISERHIVEDIWMIVNPTAHLATVPRGGLWANGYSRGLSSMEFQAEDDCEDEACPLLPEVRWTFLFQDIINHPVYTRCELELVANDVRLDGTNLHQGVVGYAPLVVADYTYPYHPLLQGWIFSDIELHVNSARKTRNGVLLQFEEDTYARPC